MENRGSKVAISQVAYDWFTWLLLYLKPVKTQLLEYNLTLDIMVFYHSYLSKKHASIWSRYDKSSCFYMLPIFGDKLDPLIFILGAQPKR